jgi:hypothetical protein
VRRFPDIFLGALLGVAIFTIGVIFGGLQYSGKTTNEPSAKTASESGQSNKKEIAWWQDPIAIFTLGLVLVGGAQLVLFYEGSTQLLGKSVLAQIVLAQIVGENRALVGDGVDGGHRFKP